MDLRTMYPPQKDSPSTFLQGDILATDTFIVVGNSDILPQEVPYPLTLGIDKTVTETVLVTAIGSGNNQLTVERSEGALAWLAGTRVARVFNAADLTALQLNVTDVVAQSNADQPRIDQLVSIVGDSESGLVKDLADEITRSTETDTELTEGKVDRTELISVVTGISDPTSSDSAMTIEVTTYDAEAKSSSTSTKILPVVTPATVGLMPSESFTEIGNLRDDVNSLQQQGGKFIGISFATKADLDNYEIPSTTNVGDFTYVLDDSTHNDATTRYIYDGTAFNFAYVINYDPVGIATTTTPGLLLSDSGSTEGNIFVENTGIAKVVGWDSIPQKISSVVSTSINDRIGIANGIAGLNSYGEIMQPLPGLKEVYVDAVSGNDSTASIANGGTYATLQKALQDYESSAYSFIQIILFPGNYPIGSSLSLYNKYLIIKGTNRTNSVIVINTAISIYNTYVVFNSLSININTVGGAFLANGSIACSLYGCDLTNIHSDQVSFIHQAGRMQKLNEMSNHLMLAVNAVSMRSPSYRFVLYNDAATFYMRGIAIAKYLSIDYGVNCTVGVNSFQLGTSSTYVLWGE